MGRFCDNCSAYRKEYDDFRQEYEDVVIIGYKGPESHFCPMYDSSIPRRIWENGDPCEFYQEKTE